MEAGIDLAQLWHGLLGGQYFLDSAYYRRERCYVTVRCSAGGGRRIQSGVAIGVLERVLAGEPPKVVACELGVAPPTISAYCSTALSGLTHERLSSRAPILVVMAALAARGLRLPAAKIERTFDDGSWLLSVDDPARTYAGRLSPCELAVARSSIQGKTHAEIARERGTSRRTVANQLASIFGKLRLSCRAELRASAVRQLAGAGEG